MRLLPQAHRALAGDLHRQRESLQRLLRRSEGRIKVVELILIFGLLAISKVAERRERAYAAEWQLILDRLHHGTELKPYDWKLEA